MPVLQHTAQELCELEASGAPAGPSPSLPGDRGCVVWAVWRVFVGRNSWLLKAVWFSGGVGKMPCRR